MDYQVSARKHRPMSFDEVSGQPHVVRTLTNAIKAGRTAHAYLFSGMRGVGKTSIARILAKALNCEKGPTATPCLTCANCVEVSRGSSFDVMEIDGASSNSVDDVREMRETVKTAPARGRYRIYIIDEVHMLSTAAFNALLKTLEEPPSHVVFIFATTEPHKIPQTILSRCQHFTFRRISRREIIEHLKRVADAEGITIDEASLSALARASDGSMRDALSLLDQAVAFAGKRVTGDDVMTLLGAVPQELLREVHGAILARDAARALRALAAVQDRGCELRQFCSDLIDYFRNLLIAKIIPEAPGTPDTNDLIELAAEEQTEIRASAARLTLEHIQDLFRIFIQVEEGLRTSLHPWWILEMAVVRAALLGGEQSRESAKPEQPAVPAAPARPAETISSARPPSAPEAAGSSAARKSAAAPPSPVPSTPRPPDAATQRSGSPGLGSESTLAEKAPALPAANLPNSTLAPELDWVAVVGRVYQERPNVGAYLDETTLVGVEGDMVTIGYPPSAGAAMRMILQEEYQRILLEACRSVSGRPLRLRVVTLAGGAASPTAAQLRREREAELERRLRDEALANPLVQEALSVFAGEVKEVRRPRSGPERGNKPD